MLPTGDVIYPREKLILFCISYCVSNAQCIYVYKNAFKTFLLYAEVLKRLLKK